MHITVIPANPDALKSEFSTPTSQITSDGLRMLMEDIFPVIQTGSPLEQHIRNCEVMVDVSERRAWDEKR